MTQVIREIATPVGPGGQAERRAEAGLDALPGSTRSAAGRCCDSGAGDRLAGALRGGPANPLRELEAEPAAGKAAHVAAV